MTCRLCGLEHRGWVSCQKAKSDMANSAPVHVANSPSPDETMANTYKYRDVEKRRAYQRELMRKRRADQ